MPDKRPQRADIPYGYCHCGCGTKTDIAKAARSDCGWVKGKPKAFIHGHHLKLQRRAQPKGDKSPSWKGGKTKISGYAMVKDPTHPRSRKSGYVMEHVLIAEKALGEPLPEGAIVHHNDHNKGETDKHDVTVCQDRAEHNLMHLQARALEACGHEDWRMCRYCKQWDDPKNLYISKNHCRHRKCHAEHEKQRQKK